MLHIAYLIKPVALALLVAASGFSHAKPSHADKLPSLGPQLMLVAQGSPLIYSPASQGMRIDTANPTIQAAAQAAQSAEQNAQAEDDHSLVSLALPEPGALMLPLVGLLMMLFVSSRLHSNDRG
jgi:hypothetical protein